MNENTELPKGIREYFANNYPQYTIISIDNDGEESIFVRSSGDVLDAVLLLTSIEKAREKLLDAISVELPRERIEKALENVREEV